MPRSRERVSEVPQRQSHKAPVPLRTSSTDSDPLHQRPLVDRSPKTGDRRSPRGSQADSLPQKRLGTRVADLESQLGQAQDELKKLKDQLASTEAAKRKAQEELDKKKLKPPVPESEEGSDEKNKAVIPAPLEPSEVQETNKRGNSVDSPDENSCETDVFEVPMTTVSEKTMTQVSDMSGQLDTKETKSLEIPSEQSELEMEKTSEQSVETTSEQPHAEVEKPSLEDMILLKDEINILKTKLEEKDKQVDVLQTENLTLNEKITEIGAEVASARVKEEEREMKLNQTEVELEASKVLVARLSQDLEAAKAEKETFELEMKAMKVQTEQWRKAADAAAAVLSGGLDMNGKFAGRCGSMDKHISGGVFELHGAYTGFEGSPLMADDLDDRYGNGKRKGAGIKMFGDLWKKKGQK